MSEEDTGRYENSEELESEEDEAEASETGVTTPQELGEPWIYLTNEEASRCLCMLGKNDSGLKYSYLMMNASERSLTDISVIPTFRNVLFVDVSGNRLTQSSLGVLASMTYLLMLKADRNRITASPEMEGALYLQVLSLNSNQISNTLGISHRLLECLELNNNLIASVSLSPYALENLKVLELRGNLLKTTNGIFFPSLVSLYVADNEIGNIEGFDTLVNLKTLHARGNRISTLDGLNMPTCVKLTYVNLRDNKIARMSEIRKLQGLPSLETLIVSENPVATSGEKGREEDDGPEGYRIKVIAVLPNLKRINKDPVLDDEREEARELLQRMLEDDTNFSDSEPEVEDE